MKGKTVLFVAVSVLFMLLALVVGIFRLMSEYGVGPPALSQLYLLHPLLMVYGFIAGVIMTERVAGIELFPQTGEMKRLAAMVPFVFVGLALEVAGRVLGYSVLVYGGALSLVAGSSLFLWLLWSFLRGAKEKLSISFMVVSAAALLLSSVVSAFELPAGNVGVIMLLLLFPIVFILGERVELTSLVSRLPSARLRPAFGIALAVVLFFGAGVFALPPTGPYLEAVGFALLLVLFGLFLREEVRPRRLRTAEIRPLQRYVSLHVNAAYVWGGIGAAAGAAYALSPNFFLYDSFIHSLAVGYIGLMLLAHGPIILPMVLRRDFDQERLSLAPFSLLMLGIGLRVAGDLAQLWLNLGALTWSVSSSGWFVLAAVVAFLVEIARGAR